MSAAAISSIALPGMGAKRLTVPAAAPLEPQRFMDGPVREVPVAEETMR